MAHGISPLDTAHHGPIHAAQLDHLGKRLATASEDHCVRVWDVETRCFVAELKGHAGPVWAVAWAHPMYGPVLASVGEDRRVLIWRVDESGEAEWWQLHKHEVQGAALAVAFSPWEYGLQLAAASSDGCVAVLSCRDPSLPTAAAAAGDAAAVGAVAGDAGAGDRCSPAQAAGEDGPGPEAARSVSPSPPPEAETWSVESFRAHAGGCFAVCWAPAASPAVAATGGFAAGAAAGAAGGGAPEAPAVSAAAAATAAAAFAAAPAARSAAARSTALEPRRLVTGGADNQVRIWRHDELTDAWADQHHFPSGEHSDWVRDVAWRPNVGIPSNTIASCAEDGTVIIWTQAMLGQPWGLLTKWQLDASAWQLSWSVTGSILAVATSSNQLHLYKETLEGDWATVEAGKELGVSEPPGSAALPDDHLRDFSQELEPFPDLTV